MILVISSDKDLETRIIMAALRDRGQDIRLFEPAMIYEKNFITALFLEGDISEILIHSSDTYINLNSVDVTWFRRLVSASAPESLTNDDKIIANNQCYEFLTAFYNIVSEYSICINPILSLYATERKFYQLWHAKMCGFRTPYTVLSNDPEIIRKEIQFSDFNWVFKPLAPANWKEESGNGEYVLPTVTIQEGDILDESVKICPAIYQKFIKKRYEIRALVLGRSAFAAKICSKTMEREFDWRMWKIENFNVEAIKLPHDILQKCFLLMKRLKLVSGVFDFIVDEDGNIIFLELNSSGNSLFLEALCCEIPILEAWCQFLLFRGDHRNFVFDKSRVAARYSEYVKTIDGNILHRGN